jgi:hypothetical protein
MASAPMRHIALAALRRYLELLLEFNPDAASLAELIAMLEKGQLTQRTTNLQSQCCHAVCQ